jgi:hypothetical protein
VSACIARLDRDKGSVPRRSRPSSSDATSAPLVAAGPRTFSRSRQAPLKTSYGAMTLHVGRCQSLRSPGADFHSMVERLPRCAGAACSVCGSVASDSTQREVFAVCRKSGTDE